MVCPWLYPLPGDSDYDPADPYDPYPKPFEEE